jgi:Tol biopolymer transport system component
MASVVPGFECDIFISYRHNDNRSGWVTDFVNALQEELAATIKEPLSIYFDKNPHDGLLETHDVDDSLKEKLKCLIFIPVISRTYCDVKSFAWNHEFLAFLKTAAVDTLGLKVKLSNGNTASRVLPIRIHELDANDKKTIETELQGVLRAIDFTFQAAGVNRPLRPKEDESLKSVSQNSYRDQINKTANAISDLIASFQRRGLSNAEVASGDSHETVPEPRQRKNWSFKIPVLNKFQIAIAALTSSMLLLTLLSLVHFSEGNHKSPTYKTTILPPDNTKFYNLLGGNVALAPDGTMMAFVAIDSLGKSLLYVRPLNALEARALKGTEDAMRPFWSPDSRFIGFFADGKLKKIDITGGPALTLCDGHSGRGGSWNQDGVIIFSTAGNAAISSVSASGGNSVQVTRLDTARHETNHRWPVFFPDGKHFVFTSRINASSPHQDDAIFLASLDSSFTPKMLTRASSTLAFANGYLIYFKGATLLAQPFDADKLVATGDPIRIADHLYFESLTSNAAFSVSQNGLLTYQSGLSTAAGMDLVWHDRNGNRLGSLSHALVYNHIRISPDGKRVAISEPNAKGSLDNWLYEINRGAWTRFTFNDGTDSNPVWSPDGKMIIYGSDIKGVVDIYLRASSGAGTEEVLLESSESKFPSDWSRDGRFIAYYSQPKGSGNSDIWILPVSTVGDKSERHPFLFLQTEFSEVRPVFSPDGRWIAYQSNESGRNEIYIRPFPGPGGKWQVSTKGGTRPHWRGDGKELFFVSPNLKGMSAEIKTSGTTVAVGVERTLFQFGNFIGFGSSRDLYDVTSDGQKFLVETLHGNDLSMPVTLVVNWMGDLKEK